MKSGGVNTSNRPGVLVGLYNMNYVKKVMVILEVRGFRKLKAI